MHFHSKINRALRLYSASSIVFAKITCLDAWNWQIFLKNTLKMPQMTYCEVQSGFAKLCKMNKKA